MKAENIPFNQLNIFSNLVLDYIHQDKDAREFYKYPSSIAAIEEVIQQNLQLLPSGKSVALDRKILSEIITQQYQSVNNISDSVKQNIIALESSMTFCVVTAHQLNVFGGPLYYIYKIAQTISTCKQLSVKYPNYNFVPVYWMGSEDHDFDEINHISVYNKKLQWQDYQKGPTGKYNPKSLSPLIDELNSLLQKEPHAAALMDLFKVAYSYPTLSGATRYLVNVLFGEYGLVVVDGDDAVFKRHFIPVIKDELEHHRAFKLVTEQIAALKSKGYAHQAMPRPLNLFYLGKNIRERIEYHPEQKQYVVLNTDLVFSEEEIRAEVEQYPERFSPNVILRPLYQQSILPAVAYIGGAGELSYWLELKTLFESYGINYPQLLLRNSVLLVNQHVIAKAEKTGFSIQDFFKDLAVLRKMFIDKSSDADLDLSEYKNTISEEFARLQEFTKGIDATLVPAVGAELQKSLQSIDAIQKRIIKSIKQKKETELNQIDKIKHQLFPEDNLQERVENFSAYYATQGPDFIAQLISAFDVYNRQFLLISI